VFCLLGSKVTSTYLEVTWTNTHYPFPGDAVTSVAYGQSAEWLKLRHPTCDFSGDEETAIMGTAKLHLRL